MTPKSICLLAEDGGGDRMAASLADGLRKELARAQADYHGDLLPLHASLEPRIWGVGGPEMARANIELIRRIQAPERAGAFWRRFHWNAGSGNLFQEIRDREPHAVVFFGPSESHRRLARRLSEFVAERRGTFNNWEPLLFEIRRGWPGRPGLGGHVITLEGDDLEKDARRIVHLLMEQDEHFPLRAHLA